MNKNPDIKICAKLVAVFISNAQHNLKQEIAELFQQKYFLFEVIKEADTLPPRICCKRAIPPIIGVK
jgi:hypothetical protein